MNQLTLIADGNWLLMNHLFLFEKNFKKSSPDAAKEAATSGFVESLSKSLSGMLSRFPEIDNIIIVSDGGSWRKALPIPSQLIDITYKGQRASERNDELDWHAIYKAFGKFIKNAESVGITTTCHSNIEGDDWVWYWSRRLNSEGTNTLIWSSDCDLKQLINIDGCTFTAWFNNRAGLWVSNKACPPDDPMEWFINPPFQSQTLTNLTKHLPASQIHYLNPDQVMINKVLCGDSGDNIKSVIRYKKGTRTYRFAQKDYEEIVKTLGLNDSKTFINSFDDIASYICNHKKFKSYGFKHDDVLEMLNYNLKLVWLHENVIPDTVTTAMVQFEYKQFDVNELKNNYKLICERESGIEELFDEAYGLENHINNEGLPF